MSLKSIYQITQEVKERDKPFLDSLMSDIQSQIDSITLQDVEYVLVYDCNLLLSALPELQKERITLTIIKKLRGLGYRVSKVNENNAFELTITWVIASLS